MSNLKSTWVEALRSGKYNQVKGTLKGRTESGEVGYCCLGVFESINGREPSLEIEDEGGNLKEGPDQTYNELRKTLYDHIMIDKLISMNDNGESFSVIADYIEENWEE